MDLTERGMNMSRVQLNSKGLAVAILYIVGWIFLASIFMQALGIASGALVATCVTCGVWALNVLEDSTRKDE